MTIKTIQINKNLSQPNQPYQLIQNESKSSSLCDRPASRRHRLPVDVHTIEAASRQFARNVPVRRQQRAM